MTQAEAKAPGIGHNGGPAINEDGCKDTGGVAGKRLKAFIERIETLNQEKSDISEDLKDLYTEVKSVGYDVKTVRKIVKLRSLDTEKRAEEDQLLALYKSAIGLL